MSLLVLVTSIEDMTCTMLKTPYALNIIYGDAMLTLFIGANTVAVYDIMINHNFLS
jgi:hypothetical protein